MLREVPLPSALIEIHKPMKHFNAIAIAAVAVASLFGTSVSAQTISDHPRWKEYEALTREQADAFAHGQKIGEYWRFCQVLNKREGVLITFESRYNFGPEDLAKRRDAIEMLDKCVADGYLTSHIRQ